MNQGTIVLRGTRMTNGRITTREWLSSQSGVVTNPRGATQQETICLGWAAKHDE